jgi:hypothetical protein
MPFIVVYDANVLYPNTLRDLLIRIAQQPHLVQAKWTDTISMRCCATSGRISRIYQPKRLTDYASA